MGMVTMYSIRPRSIVVVSMSGLWVHISTITHTLYTCYLLSPLCFGGVTCYGVSTPMGCLHNDGLILGCRIIFTLTGILGLGLGRIDGCGLVKDNTL